MLETEIILQRGGKKIVQIDGWRVPHAELEVDEYGIFGMIFVIILEHKICGPKIPMS